MENSYTTINQYENGRKKCIELLSSNSYNSASNQTKIEYVRTMLLQYSDDNANAMKLPEDWKLPSLPLGILKDKKLFYSPETIDYTITKFGIWCICRREEILYGILSKAGKDDIAWFNDVASDKIDEAKEEIDNSTTTKIGDEIANISSSISEYIKTGVYIAIALLVLWIFKKER